MKTKFRYGLTEYTWGATVVGAWFAWYVHLELLVSVYGAEGVLFGVYAFLSGMLFTCSPFLLMEKVRVKREEDKC